MPLSRILTLAGLYLAAVAAFGTAAPPRPVVAGYERFYADGKADAAAGGRLLFGELGCVNCHSTPEKDAPNRQGPDLSRVGTRAKGAWLERYLLDPHAAKPGTTMPHLLANDAKREEKAKALAHYLASTGTPSAQRADAKAVNKGRDLYSKVGCVVCHGTRKGDGDADKVVSTHVPLGDVKAKYTIASLATFLADPLHARPSGRMPRLLDGAEATAVANFLLQGIKTPVVGKGTVKYDYYEGEWTNLPDFGKLKPKSSGVAPGFEVNVAGREGNYALRFTGLIRVEREGNYKFWLNSDDGSVLKVNGKVVVNNDGIHPPQTKTGTVRLDKGTNPIEVGFFQGGGGAELSVEISGPGLAQRPVGDMVAATAADFDKKPAAPPGAEVFEAKADLAAEGKKLFASMGCANCHAMGDVKSSLIAPAASALAPAKGCLADKPAAGLPAYPLDAAQRKSLAAVTPYKAEVPPAGTEAAARASRTLMVHNCYACHVRDKVGGAQDELNKEFKTSQPEMGDEGRLPPPLDGVGAKITPEYFKTLLDKGVHDRPYMQTRMPGFGEKNVGHLIGIWAGTDKVPAAEKVTFADPETKVKAEARHMTGALAFGCIKCHTFAGQKAEGVQGIDMTIMPQKLQRDWFHYYVSEPQKVRPGTRMPTAFLDGKTPFPKILDGKAATQIEAMWVYLKDGKKARLPVGASQNSIPLVPDDTAIIYRNFIAGAGSRAIGVGFPEKVHVAFDANEMRLAMMWQGAFIDAGRHWNGRGVGYEPPMGDNVVSFKTPAPFAVLAGKAAPWPGGDAKSRGYKFRGYRLDKQDRPTFLYSLGETTIEDTPNPVVVGKETILRRTFALKTGAAVGTMFYVVASGPNIVAGTDGWYKIDGAYKTRLVGGEKPEIRDVGGVKALVVPVTFKDGAAGIVQEYGW